MQCVIHGKSVRTGPVAVRVKAKATPQPDPHHVLTKNEAYRIGLVQRSDPQDFAVQV